MELSHALYWHQFVHAYVEELPAVIAWYLTNMIAFATAYHIGPRRSEKIDEMLFELFDSAELCEFEPWEEEAEEIESMKYEASSE
jgi:hypothetical protein